MHYKIFETDIVLFYFIFFPFAEKNSHKLERICLQYYFLRSTKRKAGKRREKEKLRNSS